MGRGFKLDTIPHVRNIMMTSKKHCLQKGPYFKALVLNKDLFGILGPYLQGDFFNWPSPENVSRLAPSQICLDWPPLNFLSVGVIFTSPDT